MILLRAQHNMRAHEILLEVFDQPYEYKWEKFEDYWVGYFTTENDIEVGVEINQGIGQGGSGGPDEWFIEFGSTNLSKNLIVPRIGVTGEGDAFRIFATVIKMLGDFINEEDPRIVSFTSDKTSGFSRSKLYSALINRFAKDFGFTKSIGKNTAGEDTFELVKIK